MISADSRDKEIEKHFRRNCNDIFGIIFEIKIMSKIETFRKWLKEHHMIEDDSEFLPGYQFMIKTLIGALINAIDSNSSFRLKEDFSYHRAMHYVGLELNKMLNTCEKAVFIKNIFELAKPLWRAKSWDALKKETGDFSKNCVSIFDGIFQNYVSASKQIKMDKNEAVKNIAIFYTLAYLTDTHRGVPNGYISSVFTSADFRNIDFEDLPEEDFIEKIPEEKLERSRKIFYGYKYALQFLWYSLLSKNSFDEFISEMHHAEDWDSPDEIIIGENGELIETSDEGHYLDNYFGVINEKIVKPMEEETGLRFVFSDICVVNKSIPKKDFGILLTRKSREPKYTEEEYLNYRLYWYQAEILESKHVFNGVAAFTSVLSGFIENRRIMGIKEKISVARFKHPQYSKGQNNYSYGILIEAVSNVMADYSGWLIFFDCATDYSGFGGFEHSLAEQFIGIYKKMKKIDVIEIEISQEKLLKYLKPSTVTKDIKKIVDNWEYLQSTEKKFGESKGLLLELLLSYILSQDGHDAVKWDYRKRGIQIDVITKKENGLHFFECKTSLPSDIEKECDSFKNKVNILLKNKSFLQEMNTSNNKQFSLTFCFWENIPKSIFKILENHGIHVLLLSDYFKKPIPKFRRIKTDRLNFVLSKDRKDKYMNIFI